MADLVDRYFFLYNQPRERLIFEISNFEIVTQYSDESRTYVDEIRVEKNPLEFIFRIDLFRVPKRRKLDF